MKTARRQPVKRVSALPESLAMARDSNRVRSLRRRAEDNGWCKAQLLFFGRGSEYGFRTVHGMCTYEKGRPADAEFFNAPRAVGIAPGGLLLRSKHRPLASRRRSRQSLRYLQYAS